MKKNNKITKVNSKNVQTESATGELKKLSIILVSIVGIVCIFYIITLLFDKNNQTLRYDKEDSISQISYTDILASDIFNKNGIYYVLVKDNEDQYLTLYNEYINSYISLEEHYPVYYVDLNSAFNKKYKGEQNNIQKDSLKFKNTVLLKISNNNVESVYDNMESINSHLKSLIG